MILKNPFILAFFFIFIIISTFIFIRTAPTSAGYAGNASAVCSDGENRSCLVGDCAGKSVCVNGRWSACSWERICSPDERRPCSTYNCVNGFKSCNSCGTGYSECSSVINISE